ncbi:MAG: basic amino acid ABC transporter substrate-binding protein [Chloroflexales bacterium]|nr:basic amino acid ABC transporter substrate-binding protein [Chloroflexales bacterium]
MNRRPWIILLAMLLLAASLLAGCGSAPAAVPAAGTAVAGTAEAVAPTAAAAVTAVSGTAEAVAPTAAAAVTAVSGTAEAASGTLVADLEGRKILIGTDAAYPPFESVDPTSDKIVGFDVDLMTEIAKLINIQPEFQNAAFDTIFAALQQKQFDAVMSAATITEERAKIVAFSEPYIEVGQLVVTLAGNKKITSYADLASAGAVGVQTGTTGETAALEEGKVPDANLKRYQTIDLAFADLLNNAIDAVVADGPTVGNYVSQPKYADTLQIVGDAFTTESYGIAVQQEDTKLLSAINAALAKLKADGTIDQLKEKYQIK